MAQSIPELNSLLTSQELAIEVSDSIYISGTLESVSMDRIVVFIAGSGPTDRDCNSGLGLKTDAFKMLAEYLKSIGISTYRFDKRGIGKSTKVAESSMIMGDFISDVNQIVNYLSRDFKEIILLGHSEGALIGAVVAGQNEHVTSFISVSGISVSMDRIILDQLAQYPKLVPLAEKHIDEIKSNSELSEVHPILKSLFRPSVVPFLKSAFQLDPCSELSKVHKKVLIINGECDVQVPPSHAEKLHQANAQSILAIVPNMGHVLKELAYDCSNARAAYNDPTWPLNAQFLEAVDRFLSISIIKK